MIFPIDPLFVRSENHIEMRLSVIGVTIDPFEPITCLDSLVKNLFVLVRRYPVPSVFAGTDGLALFPEIEGRGHVGSRNSSGYFVRKTAEVRRREPYICGNGDVHLAQVHVGSVLGKHRHVGRPVASPTAVS